MRIRTIKPDFWEHPVMGKQSDATKLLAIGLLNIADDEGYFYADPKLIRNAVRPFDDESGITTVSIRDLSKIGYISILKHPTHGDIGKVVSFIDHQVINKPKPSKIKHLYNSGIDTVSIPDDSLPDGTGREGNRKDLLPVTGREEVVAENSYPQFIEAIWTMFPPMSRQRSSKTKIHDAWRKLKTKPLEKTVIESLKKWAVCSEWTKDNGQFAQGAHIWITDCKWESDVVTKPAFAGRNLWD